MNNLKSKTLKLHAKYKGKLATAVKTPLKSIADLSLVYTPGVAEVSRAIAQNSKEINKYTIKSHTIAVITDGSAVLGLGNLGPEAALPVMEGKCAIFKTFAGLDAFPICLTSQDPKEIIKAVRMIAPVFGAVNLEDISAPACFEVEEGLQDLGIPVMHDDQHGTAIAMLGPLMNAVKVVWKDWFKLKVVVSGAGAAGSAVVKMLSCHGLDVNYCSKVGEVIVLDSQGIIYQGRPKLETYKKELAGFTNPRKIKGGLKEALEGADVFIGVSAPNILKPEWIKLMAKDPIIFAMANPTPEIMPDLAKKAGVAVMATGRSDFPNQVNNALVFPGLFKGALDAKAKRITPKMKLAAAKALAEMIKKPTAQKIVPSIFDPKVVKTISQAVTEAADINKSAAEGKGV